MRAIRATNTATNEMMLSVCPSESVPGRGSRSALQARPTSFRSLSINRSHLHTHRTSLVRT